MKKLLSIILILFLFFSCKKEENTIIPNFTISGIVKNVPDNTFVYLFHRGTDNVVKIDSTIILDSTFTLKGNTKNLDFFFIYFTNNPYYVYFLIDSADNLKFKADFNYLQNYKIENSEQSKLIQLLENKLFETNKKINDAILKNIDTAQIIHQQKNYSLNFVKKNDSSLASIIALSQKFYNGKTILPIEENYELFKRIEKTLSKKYYKSEYYKQFAQFIKNYEINLSRIKPIEHNQKPEKIVDFEAKTIDGKKIKLSDYKNKWILLSFGATWCQSCKKTNNFLSVAEKENKKLEIIQIMLDSKLEPVKKLISKFNYKHIIIVETKIWQSDIVEKYSIERLPTNILISPDGKIVAFSDDINMSKIKNILKSQ